MYDAIERKSCNFKLQKFLGASAQIPLSKSVFQLKASQIEVPADFWTKVHNFKEIEDDLTNLKASDFYFSVTDNSTRVEDSGFYFGD